MNDDTLAKITMLKGSLRCFAYGLLGLLPVIGIPFAIAALWRAGKVRSLEKRFWNAAGPYRTWGIICAATGLVFWFAVAALITYNAAVSNNGGGDYDGGD